jgi:hypothetical protein
MGYCLLHSFVAICRFACVEIKIRKCGI